jgi:IclR family KDG regulon transcriptional repressor
MQEKTPTGDYIVAPVWKAMRVLSYVAESGRSVTLTEVSNALGIPKTTVFRYLQTLSLASFVAHDIKRDRYEIGSSFRTLARTDNSLHRLREIAVPVMRELNRSFNETVNLAIQSEGQMVYIEVIESSKSLRIQARIGSREPLHTTALGKSFLAYISAAEREVVLMGGLSAKTYKSVRDSKVLRRQLAAMPEKGFIIESGENEDGAICIGAPVLNDLGYPIAALSLSLPEQRHTGAVIERAVEALKAAGQLISKRMQEQQSSRL